MRCPALLVCTLGCAAAALPASAPAADGAPAIVEQSHAFFRAWDDVDAARVGELLAPGFMYLEASRTVAREPLLKMVGVRKEKRLPVAQNRKWSTEQVRFFGATAVYTGHVEYTLAPPNGGTPETFDRFLTLVWTHQDGRWQLAHWQSEDAGIEAERQLWNETYRMAAGFNAKPNRFLMEVVHGRTPGAALDVGMGQGRNALWLASQGWKVTGVDISDEGIREANDVARQQGLTLDTVQADVDHWDFGADKWDLICFIYAGGNDKAEQVKKSLKKGGIVVVEFFHADALKGRNIGAYKTGELAAMFKDGFTILRDEEVENVADWGLQRMKLVRFAAQKR